MSKRNEIGKISFEFDKEQIAEIAAAGDLSNFVNKATELFRNDLKAQLVASTASGAIALARYNGDYGTPWPWPGPIPGVFAELEAITKRLADIEALVKQAR